MRELVGGDAKGALHDHQKLTETLETLQKMALDEVRRANPTARVILGQAMMTRVCQPRSCLTRACVVGSKRG